MPKQYNCETCGFSTKYKNRIDYHINKRRSCGIEQINFCPSRAFAECNKRDAIDELNELTELDKLKILLENKEQTLIQRENEVQIRENEIQIREIKFNEIILNQKKSKHVNSQIPPKIIFA